MISLLLTLMILGSIFVLLKLASFIILLYFVVPIMMFIGGLYVVFLFLRWLFKGGV